MTAKTMAASVASHLPWSTCLVSRFVRESPFVGNPSYTGMTVAVTRELMSPPLRAEAIAQRAGIAACRLCLKSNNAPTWSVFSLEGQSSLRKIDWGRPVWSTLSRSGSNVWGRKRIGAVRSSVGDPPCPWSCRSPSWLPASITPAYGGHRKGNGKVKRKKVGTEAARELGPADTVVHTRVRWLARGSMVNTPLGQEYHGKFSQIRKNAEHIVEKEGCKTHIKD